MYKKWTSWCAEGFRDLKIGRIISCCAEFTSTSSSEKLRTLDDFTKTLSCFFDELFPNNNLCRLHTTKKMLITDSISATKRYLKWEERYDREMIRPSKNSQKKAQQYPAAQSSGIESTTILFHPDEKDLRCLIFLPRCRKNQFSRWQVPQSA